MRLRILGPLEVWDGNQWRSVGAPKWRALLAILLVRSGQPASVQQLIEELWGDQPPRGAINQIHGYVGRLRRVLNDADGTLLRSRAPGYALHLNAGDVDSDRFETLTERGLAAQHAGDAVTTSVVLGEALAMWRGPAYADVPPHLLVQAEADRLDERRLVALEARIDADLRLGRHSEIVPDLQALTAQHPLRERLWAQLMLGLYRSGRQADALEVYQRLYDRLDEELGIQPAPPLRELHRRVLTNDPSLDAEPTTGAPTATPVAPHQLPTDIADFIGRDAYVRQLDRLLDVAGTSGGAGMPIIVITGAGGVGKTTLAVHWAHRVADRFPDGQLYLDLRGYGPDPPLSALGSLTKLLRALGVAPDQIPQELDEAAATYRSLLAQRRMLVVVDNAGEVGQVRPLLPGSSGCLVVITSRDSLHGLIAAESAQPIILDLLSLVEARQFLAARVGKKRENAERDAVDAIVAACDRLPLALAIAAARAAVTPGLSLARLATELADVRRRLDVLGTGEPTTDIRAVLSWSYRGISAEAQRAFRLLGIHPGPDISLPAAASLTGSELPVMRRLANELTRARLIASHAPDRLAIHDLLRAFAIELNEAHDDLADRQQAVHRILDHYLHTAHKATTLIDPHRHHLQLDPPQPGVTPEPANEADPIAWFVIEHQILLDAVGLAADSGFDIHAWQLAAELGDFLGRRGHWLDWVAVEQAALTSAERRGDPAGRAHAHYNLARACARLGRYADAHVQLRHALDLFNELGFQSGEGDGHYARSWVYGQEGNDDEALVEAQRALELYRRINDQPRYARALNAVGWFQTRLGNHRQTLVDCREALNLLEASEDRPGQASAWDSLGHAHRQLEHLRQAMTCYRSAVELHRLVGDRYKEADTLTNLGEAQLAAGDEGAAGVSWQAALIILEELDHPDAESVRSRLTRLTQTPVGRSG